MGTSTSAYRLSLATMSRSNTGTGTVWEQESQPSRQPSQDTLSRTDEDEEESQSHWQFTVYVKPAGLRRKVTVFCHFLCTDDSMSIPSVVSEHEAFLPRVITERRFSSHATGSVILQPAAPRSTMLPSHRWLLPAPTETRTNRTRHIHIRVTQYFPYWLFFGG